MSHKFDCLITGGTRNGSAAEFTFQFVNDTEENRFICLIGNALGMREIACTVIVGEVTPRKALVLDRWREGPLVYCLPQDVARLEAEYARLEASHAELLEAVKWLTSCTEACEDLLRNARRASKLLPIQAAIAKAEGKDV